MIFPARININLSLNSGLEAVVRNLNKQIVDRGFSEISFQKDSSHIPHITLLMGEVNNELDYNELVIRCEEFGRSRSRFTYQISKPYLKQPSLNFVFIDTTPQHVFQGFRHSLYQVVGQLLRCEYHGGPDNASHITIGYSKPPYPYLGLLLEGFQVVEGCAEQMQVSVAGNRGTCIEVLHATTLG